MIEQVLTNLSTPQTLQSLAQKTGLSPDLLEPLLLRLLSRGYIVPYQGGCAGEACGGCSFKSLCPQSRLPASYFVSAQAAFPETLV